MCICGWRAYFENGRCAYRRSGFDERKETGWRAQRSQRRATGTPAGTRSQQRREGPEEERDRVRLQRRDRGRLDRSGLQPRRDPRLHRRGGRPAVAGDPADQLRADVPRRRRLLLHEQGRPRLRHELLLGDQGDGAAAGLDRRLDDRRRRRDRDGQPGADRRPLHLPPLRLDLGRGVDLRRDAGRGALDRADDRDRRDRDRALGPYAGRPARRRDRHPGDLRRGGAGQGLRRRRAPSGSIDPSFSWLNPFSLSPSEISAGMLLAVFIYWGWDTTATVNEETEDPSEAPGRATVDQHPDPARHLPDRRRGSAGLRRRRPASSPTRKTCSARSAPKSSARRWTRS